MDMSPAPTARPVAIVTGASAGIGRATAIALAEAGFEVWAGARRLARMDPLLEHGVRVLPLDVTDHLSRADFVQTVLAGSGRIDLLVNNAGIGAYGSLEDMPLDAARGLFEVNLFGLAGMVQLVMPTMRTQQRGRIINISSVGAKIYEPFASWYHASKFALEGLSDSLRLEVKPFGVDVVMVEPGMVVSEWNSVARKSFMDLSRGGAYERRAKKFARLLTIADKRRMGGSAERVARAVVEAATVERPKTRYPVGVDARAMVRARRVLPDRALDKVFGQLG